MLSLRIHFKRHVTQLVDNRIKIFSCNHPYKKKKKKSIFCSISIAIPLLNYTIFKRALAFVANWFLISLIHLYANRLNWLEYKKIKILPTSHVIIRFLLNSTVCGAIYQSSFTCIYQSPLYFLLLLLMNDIVLMSFTQTNCGLDIGNW